jgi:hypothetical protein
MLQYDSNVARKFLLNHLDKLQKNWGDWQG